MGVTGFLPPRAESTFFLNLAILGSVDLPIGTDRDGKGSKARLKIRAVPTVDEDRIFVLPSVHTRLPWPPVGKAAALNIHACVLRENLRRELECRRGQPSSRPRSAPIFFEKQEIAADKRSNALIASRRKQR